MSEKLILIVEDEKPISDILKFNLEKEGYKTAQAFDGEEGLNLAKTNEFDLILLDVMLPKMDGFQVLREVRALKVNIPIILVTAREDEIDKVLGLELGADDYITKPFSIRELMARVKANMRRNEAASVEKKEKESEKLEIGCFVLDYNRYELYKNGQLIDLTIREFDLIKFLASQPNKVFSRQSLLESVWDYEYYGDVRTVDVTVRRLREKVEDDPSEPRIIMTKRGVGYYFQP